MKSIAISIESTEGTVIVHYEPALSPAMYGELCELLSGPCTSEEVRAVVDGLAEDWSREVSARIGATFSAN